MCIYIYVYIFVFSFISQLIHDAGSVAQKIDAGTSMAVVKNSHGKQHEGKRPAYHWPWWSIGQYDDTKRRTYYGRKRKRPTYYGTVVKTQPIDDAGPVAQKIDAGFAEGE